jgi:hypothetical protein
MIADLSHIH